MSNKAVREQAEEISRVVGDANAKPGFTEILIPIVIEVLPLLIEKFKSCIRENPAPSTPQEFVSHRYDAQTGEYDRRLLKHTMEQVRNKAKAQGKKLSKDEVKDVAIATLDQTRGLDDKKMGACFRA